MYSELNNKILEVAKDVEKRLVEFLLKNNAPCNYECLMKAGYMLKRERYERDIFDFVDTYSLYKNNKLIDRLIFKHTFKFKID